MRLIGSTAFILNPEGPLTIINDAATGLSVTDDTLSVTVGATDVVVLGTNGSDDILFKAVGDFTGDLLIDARGGSDIVALKGGGLILGETTLLTGRGNDLATIAEAGGLDFAGDVRVVDSRGDDTLTVALGDGASEFAGDLSAVGFEAAAVGGESGDDFLGDVTLNNVAGGPGEVLVEGETSFAGDFALRSGRGDDTLFVRNIDDGDSAFGGDLLIDGGGGNNFIVTDLDVVGGQTTEGDVLIVAGAGDDTFDLDDSDTVIEGDLTVRGGDGDNVLLFSSGGIIGGDVTLEAGAGDDEIGDFELFAGGTVRVSLGDGDNLFDDGPDIEDEVISEFVYLGGDGFNNVDLDDAGYGDVDITVGNGANELEIDTNGALPVGGRVVIRVGNGGNFLDIDQAIPGGFTFVGGNGGDIIEFGEGNDEFFNVDLTFGSGDDIIAFGDAATITGKIDGGAGENVLFEIGDLEVIAPFEITNFVTVG